MRFRYGDSVRTNRWVRDREAGKNVVVGVIAEVVDAACLNTKCETASHPNDLYVIRYPDKHETTRYRNELRPCD